jgi:hypothetical protein
VSNQTPTEKLIGAHSLDGTDPDKCYDVLLSERNSLLTAKRAAEDEAIRGVIRFSGAALLLIPGAILTLDYELPNPQRVLLIVGVILFIGALLASFAEQLLSSWAYDRQITVVSDYYLKKSEATEHRQSARWVARSIWTSFTLFVLALIFSGTSLSWFALESTVAKTPTPSPSPPPRPSQQPSPGTKDGGRSIPPAAPPPPPKR